MTSYRRGQLVSQDFYRDIVSPTLDRVHPDLPHAAALLGRGSEVQGFDDPMSTDHFFTARVQVVLAGEAYRQHGPSIEAALRSAIPDTFAGLQTDIQVQSIADLVGSLVGQGVGLEAAPSAADWLTLNENNLRMLTVGPVHHDDIGLQQIRDRLAYYPHDVWLYLMIAAWWRVHPEANQVGRTGYVGDELGSAVIASRIVGDLMHLCFLLERQYEPYPKWFGTAFARLKCAPTMIPLLTAVQQATNWQERQDALLECYREVAAMHERLAITKPVTTEIGGAWGRPFLLRWGDFPGALRDAMTDPEAIALADRWPVGGIDRVRDVLWSPRQRPQLLALVG
ncbi:DUF4037 domain-containing protein [Microlunatus soli]|uniref:DUF4037 domain-containing protein n=1 Tax=Microlunatus soli TaxID=630515 RepID=A0A1H1Y5I4_9ACTN|nr:DUF4037 domain-containing protein [Microlunatus soli]SDT16693.1 protein of unknown function [Microlunatus soli]